MNLATPVEREVHIPLGKIISKGYLFIPSEARSIVIFALGSSISRFSPHNRFVARYLQSDGLASLLCDLLTRDEEKIDAPAGSIRFDIGLLAGRLSEITQWVASQQETQHLAIGYLGTGTGTAAAMIAETQNSGGVYAVVSHGGRPDLAGQALMLVRAPTLLIVGRNDRQVVSMNEQALELLTTTKEMVTVPGTTHLFVEPGTVDSIGRLSSQWFREHLNRG